MIGLQFLKMLMQDWNKVKQSFEKSYDFILRGQFPSSGSDYYISFLRETTYPSFKVMVKLAVRLSVNRPHDSITHLL